MSDHDHEPCDHKLSVLRAQLDVSREQVKARVATDVIRLVDRGDGEREAELYRRAVDYLVVYFGGSADPDTGGSDGGYG